jgi:hypothetical protein
MNYRILSFRKNHWIKLVIIPFKKVDFKHLKMELSTTEAVPHLAWVHWLNRPHDKLRMYFDIDIQEHNNTIVIFLLRHVNKDDPQWAAWHKKRIKNCRNRWNHSMYCKTCLWNENLLGLSRMKYCGATVINRQMSHIFVIELSKDNVPLTQRTYWEHELCTKSDCISI